MACTSCSPPVEKPTRGDARVLTIAPYLSGQAFCPSAAANKAIADAEEAAAYCGAKGENAGKTIVSFLDRLGPARSPSGHYRLGYVLPLSLLGFYTKSAKGWVLNKRAIATAVRTIHDVDRPVVVYLSANHFTDSGLALSDELAADPTNLMWTKNGPLGRDRYFVVSLHAWTLTNSAASINVLRREALTAVLKEICSLDSVSRERIAGVSLLGEVQQLYSDFANQGYQRDYDVTDYSPQSLAGFHQFLAAKFGKIAKLNQYASSAFADFNSVAPPSKDIRRDTLTSYYEHIDAYAAGVVPIQGWAYDPSGRPVRLAIYLDGRLRGQVVADLNRSDVPEADRSVSTPNVGWRYNLDYRAETPGIHKLEVFLAPRGQRKVRLASRDLTVVARDQHQSYQLQSPMVDAADPDPKSPLKFYIDGPAELAALFYNPLAALWLEYRNKVVADYIKSFAVMVDKSCLPRDAIFSHQITPQLNSNWDSDLMAVDGSQTPNAYYNPGATLYGGAAFGQAFFDWKDSKHWTTYAVSEMHPRFSLSLTQFEAVFEAHRLNGARFVAPYFMSIAPERLAPTPLRSGELYKLLIGPEHHDLGNDTYYAAIRDTMRRH